jgi:hypothetical protein
MRNYRTRNYYPREMAEHILPRRAADLLGFVHANHTPSMLPKSALCLGCIGYPPMQKPCLMSPKMHVAYAQKVNSGSLALGDTGTEMSVSPGAHTNQCFVQNRRSSLLCIRNNDVVRRRRAFPIIMNNSSYPPMKERSYT